jgi:hypothetical protein
MAWEQIDNYNGLAPVEYNSSSQKKNQHYINISSSTSAHLQRVSDSPSGVSTTIYIRIHVSMD